MDSKISKIFNCGSSFLEKTGWVPNVFELLLVKQTSFQFIQSPKQWGVLKKSNSKVCLSSWENKRLIYVVGKVCKFYRVDVICYLGGLLVRSTTEGAVSSQVVKYV